MCDDRSHERPVSGDDAVGRACCAPNRHAQGPVPKALQRGTGRIGRAEFFEPLRVEHERCAYVRTRVFHRVAKHAGAQAVNDVDVSRPDEMRSQPPGTQPEQRIRRAAIENRRPSPVCEWERHVRHRPHRELRMAEHRIRAGISGSVGGRRRCNQRHMKVTRQQASHEIVDVPLEATEAVKWIHRPRDDGDAQRLSFTQAHSGSAGG